jgi:alpha-beta hydrolase superfamily lysophospholipase
VERRVFPSLRHEIFNEPEGPEVVAEVIEWIGSKGTRA